MKRPGTRKAVNKKKREGKSYKNKLNKMTKTKLRRINDKKHITKKESKEPCTRKNTSKSVKDLCVAIIRHQHDIVLLNCLFVPCTYFP